MSRIIWKRFLTSSINFSFTNLEFFAKSKHIILFYKIFFFFTNKGNALRLWEAFDNVENEKQILLIPLKTLSFAQYPRWCEYWNYFWLDPFFKFSGYAVSRHAQKIYLISNQNSPAKGSNSGVKVKCTTFGHFFYKIPWSD